MSMNMTGLHLALAGTGTNVSRLLFRLSILLRLYEYRVPIDSLASWKVTGSNCSNLGGAVIVDYTMVVKSMQLPSAKFVVRGKA